ncbi:MAG: L-rhamnose mutarotase [Phycisphaerae bacterium]
MQRYGMMVRARAGCLEEYKRLHASVPEGVLTMIRACHIRNYSIYEKDGVLFSYFEYHGEDFEADMARMAADPATQDWWDVCKPLLEPLDTRAPGEFWAAMDEVFHCD